MKRFGLLLLPLLVGCLDSTAPAGYIQRKIATQLDTTLRVPPKDSTGSIRVIICTENYWPAECPPR